MSTKSVARLGPARRSGWVVLIALWAGSTIALMWPIAARWLDSVPEPRPVGPGGANYVIVAPTELAQSAEAWGAYRRGTGYSVQLLVVTPEAAAPEHVSAAVEQIYAASGRPNPFYVLLLGHAHLGSLHPKAYLAASVVPVDVAEFAGYADGRIASDDATIIGRFDVAGPILVGRVPARTNAEAEAVLARTRAYEAHPPAGAGRAQVELIASASGFGDQADAAIEQLTTLMAEQLLPAEYQWHGLWGNPNSPYSYPVAEFPAEVARRLEQGALLAAYIGHGQPDKLAWAVGPEGERGPVLTTSDVWRLRDASATLVALTACSAGQFVMAGNEVSVAEALLLAPGGPVSVYAPSAWIYAIANFRLAQDLFQGLLVDQPATAGEWLWGAETHFDNPGADRSLGGWLFHRLLTPFAALATDQRLLFGADARELYTLQRHAYNLFGDPALKIAYARRDLTIRPRFPWQPSGGALAFTGEGAALLPGQPVTVTLLAPTNGARRLAAESNATSRYVAANDRVVAQVSVPADDRGRFRGQIPPAAGLPGGRYRLVGLAETGTGTRVGADAVHLGWPPVSLIFLSPWVWWVGTSAALGGGLAGRLRATWRAAAATGR